MPPVHWDTVLTGLVSAALMWGVHQLTALFKQYHESSAAWRARVDEKLDRQAEKVDTLMDATQTTMRTELLHYCNKFIERGDITPEERASLVDMHEKYASLNANGLIDGYMRKIEDLPDRTIG